MILYYCDGVPYCRACIREADPRARFTNDDSTDWEYDPDGEPVGELYELVEAAGEQPCQNELNGGCMSESKRD